MFSRILPVLVVIGLLLAGCNAATPTNIPTLAVPTSSTTGDTSVPAPASAGEVTASAEIVPDRSADLSFAAPGQVGEIKVAEGDLVQAGDLLASLENQAQLAAALDASRQSLDSAQKMLDDLNASAPLALASAQLAMVNDQKRLDDAQKSLKQKGYHRCDQDTIDLYDKRVQDAKKLLDDLRDDKDNSTFHLQRIVDAESAYHTAEANYLYCIRYTDEEIASSSAELAVAEASLKQSTAQYERLARENGIDPTQAARLLAAVAGAQAAVDAAQSALDRASLNAPFAGSVINVAAVNGQVVGAGQPVLTLADLSALLVETTDLSERDISRVKVGQTARVTIPALGQEFSGKVIRVANRASKLGGDVVYKVTIQLDNAPAGLLWGMSATARIQAP